MVGKTLNSFPKIEGNVALVGNARSLLGQDYGKEIDSHDNVIRFGDSRVEGFEKWVGKKEDFRFLCYPSGGNGFEDTLSDKRIFLMAGHPAILLEGIRRLINRNKLYFISSDFRKECNDLTGKMSSLGMMAIQGFLGYELDLYGFDFFKTLHYHQDLKTDPHKFHNWDREKEIVIALEKQGKLRWNR